MLKKKFKVEMIVDCKPSLIEHLLEQFIETADFENANVNSYTYYGINNEQEEAGEQEDGENGEGGEARLPFQHNLPEEPEEEVAVGDDDPPTKSQQAEILRVHRNLGHPQTILRVLYELDVQEQVLCNG